MQTLFKSTQFSVLTTPSVRWTLRECGVNTRAIKIRLSSLKVSTIKWIQTPTSVTRQSHSSPLTPITLALSSSPAKKSLLSLKHHFKVLSPSWTSWVSMASSSPTQWSSSNSSAPQTPSILTLTHATLLSHRTVHSLISRVSVTAHAPPAISLALHPQ